MRKQICKNVTLLINQPCCGFLMWLSERMPLSKESARLPICEYVSKWKDVVLPYKRQDGLNGDKHTMFCKRWKVRIFNTSQVRFPFAPAPPFSTKRCILALLATGVMQSHAIKHTPYDCFDRGCKRPWDGLCLCCALGVQWNPPFKPPPPPF